MQGSGGVETAEKGSEIIFYFDPALRCFLLAAQLNNAFKFAAWFILLIYSVSAL